MSNFVGRGDQPGAMSGRTFYPVAYGVIAYRL